VWPNFGETRDMVLPPMGNKSIFWQKPITKLCEIRKVENASSYFPNHSCIYCGGAAEVTWSNPPPQGLGICITLSRQQSPPFL